MFNTSYDMWQKVRSYKIVSYCSGHDMQKGFNLKQCSFCSNVYEKSGLNYNFFESKSSIYPEKTQKDWELNYY